MARIVRGQLALDIGDRLKDLGQKVLHLHEYSGEALEVQFRTIGTGLSAQLGQLDSLIRSCRAAKNSYPNFPALRKAIGDAGDECYEIQREVYDIQFNFRDGSWDEFGKRLLAAAQRLRLVRFVSDSERQEVTS